VPEALDLARDFGTALLLGALLGIEREKRNAREGFGIAGLRTFIMVSQVGAIAGYLGQKLAMPWMLPVAVLAVTATVIAGYAATVRERPQSLGLTTELAAVVTCLLGALATTGERGLAAGLGIATAVLLAYKKPLHDLVGRLLWDDVLVGLRFLLATFIVLPLLPNEAIDPWGAINPYKLWLLVLLISGLSLVGYAATRWLGEGRGVAVTAAAGGLVSSTAVTLAFVKQSREEGAPANRLAGGILLAWCIMFVRVVAVATVVFPPIFFDLCIPFAAMGAASGGAAAVCLRTPSQGPKTVANSVPLKNPFSLLAAGKFVALFAFVMLMLKLAQEHLPGTGVYAIAALAGLTDVDAVTLSMAERARTVDGEMHVAVTAIAIASVSNTLVKAGVGAFLGRGLMQPVLLGTAAILVAGGFAVWLA